MQHYIQNVQLHELRKDGKYQESETGLVELNRYYSPKCNFGSKIIIATDIATSMAGISTTLIPIVATPFRLPVATGMTIGLGLYSIVRSSFNVADRVIHDDVG